MDLSQATDEELIAELEKRRGKKIAWIGQTITRPDFSVDWSEYGDLSTVGTAIIPVAWLDTCPECNQKAVTWCRCLWNERTCQNGHTWYWENEQKIIGSKHKVDSPV